MDQNMHFKVESIPVSFFGLAPTVKEWFYISFALLALSYIFRISAAATKKRS